MSRFTFFQFLPIFCLQQSIVPSSPLAKPIIIYLANIAENYSSELDLILDQKYNILILTYDTNCISGFTVEGDGGCCPKKNNLEDSLRNM